LFAVRFWLAAGGLQLLFRLFASRFTLHAFAFNPDENVFAT